MSACRLAASALVALLLPSACGGLPPPEMLKQRVATTMHTEKSCDGTATAQNLPDGVRITIPDSTLFVVGRAEFSPCGRFVLASAVEAMLAPRIMQVGIEPAGDVDAPYAGLARDKLAKLKDLFSAVGSASQQPPVEVQPLAAAPTGVWGIVLTTISPRSG